MKQHVLGAQDALKSARKRALCNPKHAKTAFTELLNR